MAVYIIYIFPKTKLFVLSVHWKRVLCCVLKWSGIITIKNTAVITVVYKIPHRRALGLAAA